MCPHLKLWACKVCLNHEDRVEELKCAMLIRVERWCVCPLLEEKERLHHWSLLGGSAFFLPH